MMMHHDYRPQTGTLDGFDFVLWEPRRAQAAYPEQAARLMKLSRLCEAVGHMLSLARQGVAYQEEVLPREVLLGATDLGFRLTDAGLACAHRELSAFVAWQAADYMKKASGFHPMDRFFAVAAGQCQINFVYGIGNAKAQGDHLQLQATLERVCSVAGELLPCELGKASFVFGELPHDRIWLIPEMDFPGPKDYTRLSQWAQETVAVRQ